MSTEHRPERRTLAVEDDSGTTLSAWYVCIACTPGTTIARGEDITQWPCPYARVDRESPGAADVPAFPFDEARCMSCDQLTDDCVCMPDDPETRGLLLAERDSYLRHRAQVLAEVTSWLRGTPRYDKDHAALLRAARRIEEWASP